MRGQSMLGKPKGSAICAFCAHRAQRPSNLQRRFLQSSRPASKPPAIAAVLREENDEYSIDSSQSNSQLSGTPLGGFGKRPAFGSQGSRSGWGKPAFGSGMIELTEEEKRVKDLIKDNAQPQHRRVVDVYPSQGPQSTRAGRPTPGPETAHVASEKRERAIELYLRHGGAPRNRLRIKKHVLNYDDSPRILRNPPDKIGLATSSGNSRLNDQRENWGQLRRRGTNQEGHSISSTGNRFMEGRAQREEESKSAGYTPLVRRTFIDARVGKEAIPRQISFSGPPVTEVDLDTRSTETGDEFSTPASKQATEILQQGGFTSTRAPVRFSPLQIYVPRIAPEVRSRVGPVQYKPTEFDEAGVRGSAPTTATTDAVGIEIGEARNDRQRRRATEYAEGDASRLEGLEEFPRSRKKEKVRQRQQSMKEYENGQQSSITKSELRRERKREKAAEKAAKPTPILLPEYISVANLAGALRVRVEDFISKMEELGFEETGYDYVLNGENAGLIAMEYNFEPIIDREISEDLRARPAPNDSSKLPPRPPVVTIMGHVDHGKTTLLDWMRKSSVAATEHGGITQHIGAFSVSMPSGKTITFLDTPGHAAFLSMRQRGANVTDIVILVVAADDSVKPQTVEAINHAKAARVPIIVAINKVDKEESNVDRVKKDLARHGIEIEDYGGDTQVVCVSGKTGQGMEELEDAVVTLSEILDMRAERDGLAEGWILEASIKPMGKVATVLVRKGVMRPSDFIVAGKTWAKIRCLRNEAGFEITEAGPGMPVEIDGWREQPEAGDEVLQAPTESKAKSVVEYRLGREERNKMAEDMKAVNEVRKLEQEKREREKLEGEASPDGVEAVDSPSNTASEETCGPKQIKFIVKGDVSGSVEALIDSIASIGNAEVQPHILRSGVGQLSEFDVQHASAANGWLVNFNTPIDPNIARQAYAAKVRIIDHNIIYRLVDGVKAALSEHLAPLITQKVLGEAEIVRVFAITIKGRQQKSIAGCKVKNGMISKNAKIRVLRHGVKVFEGSMESLKNVKKDVTEMRKGSDCGIGFEGWSDFQVGDQVQSYEIKEEERFL